MSLIGPYLKKRVGIYIIWVSLIIRSNPIIIKLIPAFALSRLPLVDQIKFNQTIGNYLSVIWICISSSRTQWTDLPVPAICVTHICMYFSLQSPGDRYNLAVMSFNAGIIEIGTYTEL